MGTDQENESDEETVGEHGEGLDQGGDDVEEAAEDDNDHNISIFGHIKKMTVAGKTFPEQPAADESEETRTPQCQPDLGK